MKEQIMHQFFAENISFVYLNTERKSHSFIYHNAQSGQDYIWFTKLLLNFGRRKQITVSMQNFFSTSC